ncbi:hypothetical protein Vafri_16133, partial [Volvox africanus]
MGRFSLRRNREDHTMDEDIEYYQPETGQTLQRSSLRNVGESESEAEGLHGGSGVHRSVAEKLRRTSVDIGRRLAGKLRSNHQNVSRADSGLPSESDVRVLEASGDTREGLGLGGESEGSNDAQRRGAANASVAAAATASRG